MKTMISEYKKTIVGRSTYRQDLYMQVKRTAHSQRFHNLTQHHNDYIVREKKRQLLEPLLQRPAEAFVFLNNF
jgi:hypothetical protein